MRWLSWWWRASRPTRRCTRKSWLTPRSRAVHSTFTTSSVASASSESTAFVSFLELSFALGELDPDAAEQACVRLGALSVSFSDERDDAVYEPRVGEIRLWPATRVQALYAATDADP